jgi:hypothetical protein
VGLTLPSVPPNDNLSFRTGEFSLFVILGMGTPEQECHGDLERHTTNFHSGTRLRFARAVSRSSEVARQHGNGVADSLPLGSENLDVQLGRRLPLARPPRCLFHVALVSPRQLSLNEIPVLRVS